MFEFCSFKLVVSSFQDDNLWNLWINHGFFFLCVLVPPLHSHVSIVFFSWVKKKATVWIPCGVFCCLCWCWMLQTVRRLKTGRNCAKTEVSSVCHCRSVTLTWDFLMWAQSGPKVIYTTMFLVGCECPSLLTIDLSFGCHFVEDKWNERMRF